MMDNVLANFQSGIDRLDEATLQAYEGRLDEVPGIFVLIDSIKVCPAENNPSAPLGNIEV